MGHVTTVAVRFYAEQSGMQLQRSPLAVDVRLLQTTIAHCHHAAKHAIAAKLLQLRCCVAHNGRARDATAAFPTVPT